MSASDLLDVAATEGEITEEGLRSDVNVGIQYISSWLRGNGAAAIYNLREDAATSENRPLTGNGNGSTTAPGSRTVGR